jgi:hypothetical protein
MWSTWAEEGSSPKVANASGNASDRRIALFKPRISILADIVAELDAVGLGHLVFAGFGDRGSVSGEPRAPNLQLFRESIHSFSFLKRWLYLIKEITH